MAPPMALDVNFDRRSGSPESFINCCCGRPDCPFLKKNCSVLESVEKDVHTAAQLGQALLARHEAYMADAERDRLELTSRIERLEKDKHQLEAANATKVEENRQLSDQLEMLNSTVSESDTKIRSLEASLLSSQQTVRRLEAAAARAEDAERHLSLLEEEQMKLHSDLRLSREDARTHAQRCKEAQRGILDMQDQLERMEQEAQQERKRHAEIISRMERQRDVEKQLDTAAGRLKGAAASKSLSVRKDGSSVVSHFVRDLLQDNASLQLGIAELREMLLNSNSEIQMLRGQLMNHQPAGTSQDELVRTNLHDDLAPQLNRETKLSQELHVHHHYHVPRQDARKPKKKRQGLTPGGFYSPSISSGTATPVPSLTTSSSARSLDPDGDGDEPTTPANNNSKTEITTTPTWSGDSALVSEFTSSVASSPRSHRVSSIFDASALGTTSPASPTTSYDPMSPTWRAHSKRTSNASHQSIQTLSHTDLAPDTALDWQTPSAQCCDNIIREEDEDNLATGDRMADMMQHESPSRSRLRRTVSHGSIMSLKGGLDIHTLKSRPSQMTLRPIGGVQAVVTGVTAQPTMSLSSSKRSDVALRDQFSRTQTARSGSLTPSAGSATRSPSPSSSQRSLKGGLGKLVGWRPWAGSNASSTNTAAGNKDLLQLPSSQQPSPAGSPAPSITTTATDTVSATGSTTSAAKPKDNKVASRTPGINQPGSIPGFQEYWASQARKGAPAKVNAETIDHDALAEGLRG
ncbi:Chromosome segregation ATPase [Geosmithia morbida]|uniref:Chromosome segregation ATPase n=1 Tax=Geosmithia morbida TaxID=1094350 RepID=A0A9P5D2H1_9HYPO|nr:Chromosome segregation ATPase [Geosmithia morbida]KAF4121471.1 Chromosome segregation ATPase [Geosmithia morbida]